MFREIKQKRRLSLHLLWNVIASEMGTLEWVAALLGALSVWLTIKQKVVSWPIGAVMAALYIYVFREARLYADMGLQGIYLLLQLYGWYEWGSKASDGHSITVSRISYLQAAILFLLALVFAVGLGQFLKFHTDAALPFLDSAITAFSLAAQWMLAKKKIENWPVWFVVDVVAVGVFAYKGLYATALLYFVFCGMAVAGYRVWLRELAK